VWITAKKHERDKEIGATLIPVALKNAGQYLFNPVGCICLDAAAAWMGWA